MINDTDAIRRRSTPSRKNAEHDVFGSPCGLSVEAEAHIFDSNGNKLLAVGRVERPHGKALRKVVNSSASSIERMKGMSADERRKVKAREEDPSTYKLATELNCFSYDSIISTTRSQ